MLIHRQQIAQLIPHGEAMCLLDQITDWDEHHLYATTASHRRENNPLIENGPMDTVALVEYGAQAAAVHAALKQSGLGAVRPAYLGAIKKLHLFSEVIDASVTELQIQAQCIFKDDNGAIYDIRAHARSLSENREPTVEKPFRPDSPIKFVKYAQYSPHLIKKSDSKCLPLATVPIFGQAPRENNLMTGRIILIQRP